jgi:predicted amidohydrolase
MPWAVHAGLHNLRHYADEPFPVAERENERIRGAIFHDYLFTEAIRQLALNGAELLVRVSAYMDPWDTTPSMD